ncbi:tannase/feruloyl esterase family alpha/beta hydrolase [Actinoallomurus iriomotensis]|uniref:tannase/feruloyl esterase family alpha/beta hydrolase n=1 Tax=Actinoallomurus iriomotensis TaxID=478107 RepID=UPI003D7F8DE5
MGGLRGQGSYRTANPIRCAAGTRDGLISDSLDCSFDPKSIACPANGSSSSGFCLNPAQLESVQKIYGGARDDKNRLMYPGDHVAG